MTASETKINEESKNDLERLTLTKVYIGNLPKNLVSKDLEDLFAEFGSLKRFDVVKNFAFAFYANKEVAEEAITALNDTSFQGVRIQVQMAKNRFMVDEKDSNSCFECGATTHWAKDCPNRVTRPPKRPMPSSGSSRPRPPLSRSGPHSLQSSTMQPERRQGPPILEPGYETKHYVWSRDGYALGDYPPIGGPPPSRRLEYLSNYRPRSRSPPTYPHERGSPPRDVRRDQYARLGDLYSQKPYARAPFVREPFSERDATYPPRAIEYPYCDSYSCRDSYVARDIPLKDGYPARGCYPRRDTYSNREDQSSWDSYPNRDGYPPGRGGYPQTRDRDGYPLSRHSYSFRDEYTSRGQYLKTEGYLSRDSYLPWEGYSQRESYELGEPYPSRESHSSRENYSARDTYPAYLRDSYSPRESYAGQNSYTSREGYKSREPYVAPELYGGGDPYSRMRAAASTARDYYGAYDSGVRRYNELPPASARPPPRALAPPRAGDY